MAAGDAVRRLLSNLRLAKQDTKPRPSVDLEVSRLGGLPLLYLSGELDHHAAAHLRPAIESLLIETSAGSPSADAPPHGPAEGGGPVGEQPGSGPASGASPGQNVGSVPQPFAQGLLMDIGGLDYIDSGGLALLFDIARTFDEEGEGACLGILNPTPQVRRLLDISGLREMRAVTVVQDARATKRAAQEPTEPGSGLD
jgi:ABC-type transporter Mla MlaB component